MLSARSNLGPSRRSIPRADLDQLDPPLRERVLKAQAQADGAQAVFAVLANHPYLLDKWLRFAGGLLVRGKLERRHAELLILRTAHNCDCAYEWGHHVAIGRGIGMTEQDFAAVRGSSPDSHIPELERTLLTAADELHTDRRIGDGTWNALSARLTTQQLLEVCMLVGQYEMLAMVIKSAGLTTE